MNIEILVRILAALVVMHSIHAISETSNMRAKVRKLKAAIDGTPFPEKSFKIDTPDKVIGVAVGFNVVLFGLVFLLFSWLQLSTATLLVIAIALIILVEIASTTGYDRYHSEISA